jgi:hypothetical protein
MGDETFNQLFLFIQIGNYLWNLVFYLGSPNGRRDILPIVPFIQIGNYLWNLVFHLGSQMGDETFYCLFFAFWFWNIDGAVGRRVMLTWTFIMYFGQVRLRARYERSVN